jgi:hypothetical protein
MITKSIRYIGFLLVFLMIIDAWLFINYKIEIGSYVLVISIFIVYIIFRFFIVKTDSLIKRNAGLSHVLDKSEEKRVKTEELNPESVPVNELAKEAVSVQA